MLAWVCKLPNKLACALRRTLRTNVCASRACQRATPRGDVTTEKGTMRRLVAWTICGTAVTLCVIAVFALDGRESIAALTTAANASPLLGAASGLLWIGSSMSATPVGLSLARPNRTARLDDHRIRAVF